MIYGYIRGSTFFHFHFTLDQVRVFTTLPTLSSLVKMYQLAKKWVLGQCMLTLATHSAQDIG